MGECEKASIRKDWRLYLHTCSDEKILSKIELHASGKGSTKPSWRQAVRAEAMRRRLM